MPIEELRRKASRRSKSAGRARSHEAALALCIVLDSTKGGLISNLQGDSGGRNFIAQGLRLNAQTFEQSQRRVLGSDGRFFSMTV
jgi:hypothetical protein